MHILRIINTVNPASGGPIHGLTESSHALRKLGHHIHVASVDDPGSPWVNAFPFTLHALGPARSSYGYSPNLKPWLSQNIKNYDAILVHGLWQYHGFALHQVWNQHQRPAPYFVFTHGMLDPWFKRAYPLKHLKKCLYWPWAEYRVLRDASAVLFTSEEERLLARESFSFYRARERVVAYGTASPGLDLQNASHQFFQNHPSLRNRPFLIFLGRLHEKKGIDLLIKAWQHLNTPQPPSDLVIAGPGLESDYGRELRSLAKDSPHIHFVGPLAGPQKWGALAAAEALILPSHQENFGIVVAEALAVGTPVLISRAVNIWREIVDAGAGFAEDDTLSGTQNLITQWQSLSPASRDIMKQRALSLFQTRYTIEAAANDLLNVINERTTQTKNREPLSLHP